MDRKKKEKLIDNVTQYSLAIIFIYAVIAISVFRFRHPWATGYEQAIHTWELVTFQKVPYEEFRPR